MSCFRGECCPEEQENGILLGEEREIKEIVPLTTYFRRELKSKRIRPQKPAIVYKDISYNFSEFELLSSQIATHLKNTLGTEIRITNPDDDLVLAVCVQPSEKLVGVIFAILKIGAAYLPLDPNYPPPVLLNILKAFRPIAIVTEHHSHILSHKKSFPPNCLTLKIDELWDHTNLSHKLLDFKRDKPIEVMSVPHDLRPIERPAVLLHTEGFIKTPRGVRVSHTNILNRIFWSWKILPYRIDGCCCLTVPPTIVDSLLQIFSPLLRGITLHIYDSEEVENMGKFIRNIGRDKITRISLTSVALSSFLNECRVIGRDEARMILKTLKFVCCKGSILTHDLALKFFYSFPSDGKALCTMYGYTELTGDVATEKFFNIREVRKKTAYSHVVLGNISDNCIIYIMGESKELKLNGTQGQICIGGYPLVMGSIDRRQESSFITNPYDLTPKYARLFQTGDFGRMAQCKDKRYRLLVEGRGDNFLRHNGYEFLIEDIKDVLKAQEGVEHCTLFIFRPGKSDQTIIAFVLLQSASRNKNITSKSLESALKKFLPSFMVPTVKLIDSFPLLPNGRLNRHGLMKSYLEEREIPFSDWDALKINNKNASEAAKVLMETLFRLSSIPIEVSLNSLKFSFYDLGGNSMMTVNIVVHLNRKGFPISIQDFIGAENIEDLINLMENRRTLQNFRKHTLTSNGENNGSGVPPLIHLAIDYKASQSYISKHMEERHKKDVISIISNAYVHHGEIDRTVMVLEEEYEKWLELVWDPMSEQQLTFVICRNSDNSVVGVTVGMDFYTDLIPSKAEYPIRYILEFVQEMKGLAMIKLNLVETVNEVYEAFLMATVSGLLSSENVRLIVIMVNEVIRRAIADGFKSVYISSTSQIIRDLLLDIFEFQMVDDYVVSEFETESGTRPFHLAPGTMTMTSYYKVVNRAKAQEDEEGGDKRRSQKSSE